MLDKFKILILYALKDIKVVDIRKIILEKIFDKYFMTRINYIPHLPNYSNKYLHINHDKLYIFRILENEYEKYTINRKTN